MKIAVIGTGNVGGTLGSRWAQAGHQVVFGSRSPQSDKLQKLLSVAGENASAGSMSEATGPAEIVVLAIPWNVSQETILAAGDFANKIVLDATNPIAPACNWRWELRPLAASRWHCGLKGPEW